MQVDSSLENVISEMNCMEKLQKYGDVVLGKILSFEIETGVKFNVFVTEIDQIYVYVPGKHELTIDELNLIHGKINMEEELELIKGVGSDVGDKIKSFLWVYKSDRGDLRIFPFELFDEIKV